MKYSFRKLKLLFTFWQSLQLNSLAVMLAVGLLLGLVGADDVFLSAELILKLYPLLGIGLAVLYRETMKKDEYFFYYNGGCSKYELWSFSFFLSVFISLILYVLLLWVQF